MPVPLASLEHQGSNGTHVQEVDLLEELLLVMLELTHVGLSGLVVSVWRFET